MRFDHFDLNYHNNRNGDTLARARQSRLAACGRRLQADHAGVRLRQLQRVVSAELRRSVLVADDDHRSRSSRSSSRTTRWARSGTSRPSLSLTTAVYRLNRTNTRSTDPNDPTRIVQTGSQRTNGYELGVNGRMHAAWSIAGGYAYQDAFVTSATAARRPGAIVGQVPHHTLSLWNNYQVASARRRRPRHPLPQRHVRGHRQHRHAARATRGPTRPRSSRSRRSCVCRRTWRTCSTRATTSTPTATPTSRPGFPRALRVGLTTAF